MDTHPMELPWDEEYWQVILEQGEIPRKIDAQPWKGGATEAANPFDNRETHSPMRTGAHPDGGSSLPKQEHSEEAEREGAGNDLLRSAGRWGAERNSVEQIWGEAADLLERGGTVHLPAVSYNRGGLIVQWDQVQGFVPASHLTDMPRSAPSEERNEYLKARVGQTLCLKVVEIDRSRQRLVLSERIASMPDIQVRTFESIYPGLCLKGCVSTVCHFGAFVDLGGLEGLIHISELSWERVGHPAELLQVGQEIEVKVISTEPASRKVALSMKQLQPDPWQNITKSYHVGQIVRGVVTSLVGFGAFVKIVDGIEGLIHISEMAPGRSNSHQPYVCLHEGEEVEARIVSLDEAQHRLGLSLRIQRDEEEDVSSSPHTAGENNSWSCGAAPKEGGKSNLFPHSPSDRKEEEETDSSRPTYWSDSYRSV